MKIIIEYFFVLLFQCIFSSTAFSGIDAGIQAYQSKITLKEKDATNQVRYGKESNPEYASYINNNKDEMLKLLNDNNTEDIMGSLKLLTITLDGLEFGDTLKPSVIWFKQSMKDWQALCSSDQVSEEDKAKVAIKCLMNACFYKENEDEIMVSPFFKNTNEIILKALSMKDDINSISKLIKQRLFGESYDEFNATPTNIQLDKAKFEFRQAWKWDSERCSKLMLVSDMIKYGGLKLECCNPQCTLPTSGNKCKDNKTNFELLNKNIVLPETYTEMMKMLENGELVHLKLDSTDLKPSELIEYPDSLKDYLKYPYTVVCHESKVSIWEVDYKWVLVNAMLLGKWGVFFSFRGARPPFFHYPNYYPSRYLKKNYWNDLKNSAEYFEKNEILFIPYDNDLRDNGYALGIAAEKGGSSTLKFRAKRCCTDTKVTQFEISKLY
jgi:hypothetical protein